MKRGSLLIRVVVFALFLFVAIYMGVYIADALYNPLVTTIAVQMTVEETQPVVGFFMRDEAVIPSVDGIVKYLAGEGERVSKSQTVAKAYLTEQAYLHDKSVGELQSRVDQLAAIARTSNDISDAVRLDGAIAARIIGVADALGKRELTFIGDQSAELKSMVIQREYSYGDNEGLNRLVDSLRDELGGLISSATKDAVGISAPAAGSFSARSDGYEDILKPEDIVKLMPGAFESLTAKTPQTPPALGKMIYGNKWYYVFVMAADSAGLFKDKTLMPVRYFRGFSRTLDMSVECISSVENGKTLVVLSSDRYLAETTLLRRQSGDVLLRSYTGLRIPKEAIRVTGGVSGVYCLIGLTAQFTPVDIIYEKESYYLVGYDPDSGKGLRPGDEIIISAKQLEDGKIVR